MSASSSSASAAAAAAALGLFAPLELKQKCKAAGCDHHVMFLEGDQSARGQAFAQIMQHQFGCSRWLAEAAADKQRVEAEQQRVAAEEQRLAADKRRVETEKQRLAATAAVMQQYQLSMRQTTSAQPMEEEKGGSGSSSAAAPQPITHSVSEEAKNSMDGEKPLSALKQEQPIKSESVELDPPARSASPALSSVSLSASAPDRGSADDPLVISDDEELAHAMDDHAAVDLQPQLDTVGTSSPHPETLAADTTQIDECEQEAQRDVQIQTAEHKSPINWC